MTTTASPVPKNGRRGLRAATDVAAAALIASGALLVAISVGQHQHYEHALAVHAARKAQVDRAAVAEAQQFRAQLVDPQRLEARQRQTPTRPAHVGARTDQVPSVPEVRQLGPGGLVLAADHKAAVTPARRQSAPVRPKPAGVTQPGAVSEIRGTGAVLVIPALGVRAPVVATGAVNGTMAVPADVHIVGWYNGRDTTGGTTTSGPTPWPGQSGVSVLAGHINWVGQGPGALYYIGQLVVGDPLEVIGSNHVATFWRVSRPPITTPKPDLPDDLFVNRGPPKLALVTCGGPYDAGTGHYLDNVIVWATLH